MKPIFTLLLLLALQLTCWPAAADERLEAWQKRVLEALEEAAEREGAESPEDGDGDRSSLLSPREADAGARRAAQRAERSFGGRVLAVQRRGDVYRVRLLLDNGRVKTVTIED